MFSNKTLVVGASLNPSRYSHMAIKRLQNNEVLTEAFGLKSGSIGDVQVKTNFNEFQDIHTITLYLTPKHQAAYLQNFLELLPKRIIFNPGTEHPEIYPQLKAKGIEVLEACTLVLLATGQY